ncbi:MAG: S8 family serine peptidase, partial [Acidimicrobiia bacterium]|nr:S8 family serine peptidase [Acidimicrobiia bacterium]
ALRNPALDPFVIAVGATNSSKTRPGISSVMEFSNCGTSARHVDIAVPGQSIASLRSPGSAADVDHPESVIADRFMLGSGTSQSAAFVSGLAALLADENPQATPDQIKAALMDNSGAKFKKTNSDCYGAGVPNMDWTASSVASDGLATAPQLHAPATGLGTLDGARGSAHLEQDGVVLEGEQDIFGNAWSGWCTTLGCQSTFWDGGTWNGATWAGGSWSGGSWSGTAWAGGSWSGGSWSGGSWSGGSWSGGSWSGSIWLGLSWD